MTEAAPRARKGERGPTIFDVGKRAGVSHQTVSRVINGDPTVRPHIREQVQTAIRELAYRPRAAARALAAGSTRALGVISTGGALYGPTSTALSFNKAARAAGYHVMSATLDRSDPASMREAVETLLAQDVAAIVLVAADSTALDALESVRATVTAPIVIANAPRDRVPGAATVAIDQAAGAALAVRHLLVSGRSRLALVTGPTLSQEAVARRDSAIAVLREEGLEPTVVAEGDWTPDSGYAIGSALDVDAVDAVLCGNDQMALGVLHALADRGVAVPDRIAVVGFDDVPEAAHFIPPLTTVRQDFAALGEQVLAAVSAVLAGSPVPDVGGVPPELVVRASA